uniref:3-deoxy-D-manno-octulosonate 8-phosphate phosphatase KdsC n=2 Tax=unclassified Candidatus Kentrum TaxID=2643149 RepID=A0A451AN52_9GAMM|nr:MAG: 3-deoxy-D-manno-octulosonate 8-phosphate phosphatase (KDO 8-P phosphatase) [Candidatus Kentron sp. LPFa]VFK15830.1 MAG: 3-deoxy-D-manno-octulosonate 8-phosphate phosphatase (KDO 8-P phosphatase) [Candidatus Kentron sp. LPFa]VFK33491.1 MAG: 3-deoxy-D-manno-octulosonate 8-phosphate phosphatase (KDO 8-P phosphatase) [Candidatus Kentron sp. LPFa]VFK67447.1 MAG: 3-deoxy-D-manno-octulosonate 8-phosphate phosphatase (KDO 8-P phosphatase) [Candidatus Kentron sp. UNK]VFK71920.1 MAG: 3-deoxy-D-ma
MNPIPGNDPRDNPRDDIPPASLDALLLAPREILARAANIRIVVFDVDGVLTDGSIYLDSRDNEYKAFHVRDGHGMKMLMESGVEIGVITGRDSPVVTRRMTELGITHLHQGCGEKRPVFEALLKRLGLAATDAAYMGDDIVDLPVMRRAHLAISVADAHPLVKQYAHWLTPSAGGRGAAREACELILSAQGALAHRFERSLG